MGRADSERNTTDSEGYGHSVKQKSLFNTATSILFSFEMVFVLFLFAGRFKADPRFAWVPIDITALFLGVGGCIGGYILIKRNFIVNVRSVVLLFFYLVFLGYTLYSLTWSPSVVYAQEKAVNVAVLTLWTFFAAAIIIGPEEVRLKRFLIALFVFSFWFASEGLIMMFSAQDVYFISILGGNYLGFGRVLGIGIILLLGFLFFTQMSSFRRSVCLVLAIVYIYLMFYSGGRGPLLATVFSCSLIVLLSIRLTSTDLRLKRYLFPLIGLVAAGAVYIVYLFQTDALPTTLYRIALLFHSGDMGDSAEARVDHIFQAISLWSEKPVFGHGIGAWPVINGEIDSRYYPHNIILELLVELGIVGFVMLAALVVYAFRGFTFRIMRRRGLYAIIYMLFLHAALNALVSGDLADNRFLFCTIGLAAVRFQARG